MKSKTHDWLYSRTLMWAVVQTGVVLSAAVLAQMFAGGPILQATCGALLGYWLMALTIWQRNGEAQPHEVFFAKYGIVAILFTALVVVFVQQLFH